MILIDTKELLRMMDVADVYLDEVSVARFDREIAEAETDDQLVLILGKLRKQLTLSPRWKGVL